MCTFIISLLSYTESPVSFVKCSALFTYGIQKGFLLCVFVQLSVHLAVLLVLLAKVLPWLTSSNPSLLATKTKGSMTWPMVNFLGSTLTRLCPTVYVPVMPEQVGFSAHNKLFLTWPVVLIVVFARWLALCDTQFFLHLPHCASSWATSSGKSPPQRISDSYRYAPPMQCYLWSDRRRLGLSHEENRL